MRHTSMPVETPIEIINVTSINPLISKCQIKVCYVGDEPNRNRSVITKEVAKEMANSLPGSPIVGYYNETSQDFEEHNRIIDISNGEFKIKETTRPYGFIDLNAKVWFQKFLDDGTDEREYLVTEGYLWTGQYPECERVMTEGNNQSMELDEKTLNAVWTKNEKDNHKLFIINEAIISKLCILGEDVEPCFEGATITNVNYSLNDSFKEQLLFMMKQLTDLLEDEGGAKQMFTQYAVEIGDALWSAIYDYLYSKYPSKDDCYCSKYGIEGIYEEENGDKFAILRERGANVTNSFFRLDFALSDSEGFVPSEELVEVTKTFTPSEVPMFALDKIEEYEAKFMADKQEEKEEKEELQQTEEEETEEEVLDDVIQTEYSELQQKYSELENSFNELNSEFETLKKNYSLLEEEAVELRNFKSAYDRKEKEAMIESFYMLSEEDKADVVENIDNYSLDDIEAKLSIICVRNKVNFNLDTEEDSKEAVTFNLDGDDHAEPVPAWVKAVMEARKNKN